MCISLSWAIKDQIPQSGDWRPTVATGNQPCDERTRAPRGDNDTPRRFESLGADRVVAGWELPPPPPSSHGPAWGQYPIERCRARSVGQEEARVARERAPGVPTGLNHRFSVGRGAGPKEDREEGGGGSWASGGDKEGWARNTDLMREIKSTKKSTINTLEWIKTVETHRVRRPNQASF